MAREWLTCKEKFNFESNSTPNIFNESTRVMFSVGGGTFVFLFVITISCVLDIFMFKFCARAQLWWCFISSGIEAALSPGTTRYPSSAYLKYLLHVDTVLRVEEVILMPVSS